MDLKEILQRTPEEIVKALMVEREDKPKLKDLKEQWNVSKHRVMTDKTYLPDKQLKNAKGEPTGTKFVNRIAGPFQKMIVNRAVSFGFANPILLSHNAQKDSRGAEVIDIMEKILYANKTNILDRQIARELYRSSEVAEIWYYVKTDVHQDYGFPCKYKLKVKVLKPWENDMLYPLFDGMDDLAAFSRGYVVLEGDKKVEILEVYTDNQIIKFKKDETGWIQESSDAQILKKIPVIYAHQEQAEWSDVQSDIERLELLFSRHAEINDYHSSPKTFIKGTLVGMPAAGESNGIIQGGADSDMKVISWAQSSDSIKLEIESRLENIHKFTQTPDISFNSIKAMNQVSGVMLKMLFMDAHLKVMEKAEIWDVYFQRRYSVIKNFIGILLKPDLAKDIATLEIQPEIRPYMISDEKERIENLMTANGNKPILSRQTSVKDSDLTIDPEAEMLLILAEEKESNIFDITETVEE